MRPRQERVPENGAADTLMTFVTSETQGTVHVFVPDIFDRSVVEGIAQNFSRRVQQPVKVFHDEWRQKYRLCPLPSGVKADILTYGTFYYECDLSEPKPAASPSKDETSGGKTAHIPRPRNSWILYRQYKAAQIQQQYPGITASELSTMISRSWKAASKEQKKFWQQKAREEDRLHKEKYPDYKYTTKKSTAKKA
ncbi:hypothetical protein CDD83_2087 [Cordyceps sp. RAO-2017]|nr:hypothetical protein CDD83_2087 [Cordyceps sp. RAO-2017]